MRHLLTLLAAAALLTASAAAQTPGGQWIPGLDIIVPGITVYSDRPGSAVFGYDRDSRKASVMFPDDGCYIIWWITPAHGAIRHVFEYRPDPKSTVSSLAVYYESGYMQVETIPNASFCIPL